MTNAELAKWIEDNIREPSGYPDGSVIWRLNLSNEKVAQITGALRVRDELLEALKVLVDEATSFNVGGVYFDEKCMGHKGPAMAYAAIAKAEARK